MARSSEDRFLRRAIADSPTAAERGLQPRPYQIALAEQAFRALHAGNNVGVTLPTGAGKTMVADLVTRIWMDRRPGQTSLSVVPRRVLVEQHLRHARWLVPPLNVTSLRTGNQRDINRRLRDNDIIVTTPRLLGTAIKNDRVDDEYLQSISLVVIDEADAMLSTTWTDDGIESSIHDALQLLLDGIPAARFLLLTATPPVNSPDAPPDRAAQADTIAQVFRVRNWKQPSPSAMRAFMPKAVVHWQLVDDVRAIELDRAIDDEITLVLDLVEDKADRLVDTNYFRSRYRQIASGTIQTYPTTDGRRIRVTTEIRQLCIQLTRRYGQRLFVYEDDMRGFSTYSTTYRQRPITRLVAPPNSDGHDADLGIKLDCVTKILADHTDEAGIIFIRYLTVATDVQQALEAAGHQVGLLHGGLDDSQRASIREWFRRSKGGLLVLTRETGARGLDIPEADFAIFYSPKANVDTMWQEMSRIRATVQRTKPSYVLVHNDTNEVAKATSVSLQMQKESGRFEQNMGLLQLAP